MKDAVVLGAHHEKCIRRPVQIVGKNVKFLLNQTGQNLFTVGTVINNINQRDFNKNDSFYNVSFFTKSFFYFFYPFMIMTFTGISFTSN
jgi:hypothetical protein